MADSSSDESDEQWVFYRDRPEWEDVTPIQQAEGKVPVVAIAYSEKFKDVYDYFRAVLHSQEKSERALELTKDAAALNPANYTVWMYRREILRALEKDLYEELNYITRVINQNLKNYQVWHHRRILVEWLNDASNELEVTKSVLSKDAKNYHAWQHRQWAIKTYNLFDGELDYINELITDDIRNNSAWNQRYFVLNNTTGFTDEVLEKEIKYTLDKILIAKHNESSWNYLRGLLFQEKDGSKHSGEVRRFCETLYAAENRSPFLLAMIVQMCEDEIAKGNLEDPLYNLARVEKLCEDLANEYDPVRYKYWNYLCASIQRKANKNKGDGDSAENKS